MIHLLGTNKNYNNIILQAALNDPEDKKKLPVIVFIHGSFL